MSSVSNTQETDLMTPVKKIAQVFKKTDNRLLDGAIRFLDNRYSTPQGLDRGSPQAQSPASPGANDRVWESFKKEMGFLPPQKQVAIEKYEKKKVELVYDFIDFYSRTIEVMDDDGTPLFTKKEALDETVNEFIGDYSYDDVLFEAAMADILSKLPPNDDDDDKSNQAEREELHNGWDYNVPSDGADVPADVKNLLTEACNAQQGKSYRDVMSNDSQREEMKTHMLDLYLKTRSLVGITDEQAAANTASFMMKMMVPHNHIDKLLKEMIWDYFKEITFQPYRQPDRPAAKSKYSFSICLKSFDLSDLIFISHHLLLYSQR